jgi:PAS domain S-box-containing protein
VFNEYPTTTRESVLRDFSTHGFWSGEVIQISKSRERLPILASVSKVFDTTGSYIGAVAIHKDMREMKRAQLALQQMARRYRQLLEQAAEGILVTDQTLQLILVNQALCEMLGYNEKELLQMRIPDLIHPENLAHLPLQTDAIRSGKIVKSERLLKRKDGSSLLVVGSAKMLPDGTIQTILHDITERKQAEEKLQQTEAFYRTVTEQSSEGVMVFDQDMIIRYRSPSQLHMASFPYEEMVGQDRTDTIHPEDLKAFLLELPHLQAGQTLLNTFRMQNKQGSWDWFESHVTNLLAHPAIQGYVANYYNINERKAAEVMQRELSQRLLNVQEDERRSLARELHDEIGQSLTAVKVGLQTAQRLGTSEPIANAMSITDQLLSQVRELSLNLHPGLLEDLGLAAAVRWYALQQAERSGIKIDFTLCLGEARLSPELKITIYRIVQEGLTNIIRHSQAHQVCISLTEQNHEIHLTIKDDGVGFDATLQSKASLGLLSMKERVSLRGGQFQLESAPKTGTAIQATFPLRD